MKTHSSTSSPVQGAADAFRSIRRNITKVLMIVLLGFSVATPSAMATTVDHPKSWGLGIMLGAPTGITVKNWIGGSNAWDLGLGFGGFGVGSGFRLHGDFLWGLAQVIPNPTKVTLDVYLGAGPVLGLWHDGWCRNGIYRNRTYNCRGTNFFLGGRVPIGLDLLFAEVPIELGLEIAPGLVANRNGASFLVDAFLLVRFVF